MEMNILSTNNNQIFRKIENVKSEKMETFRKNRKFLTRNRNFDKPQN